MNLHMLLRKGSLNVTLGGSIAVILERTGEYMKWGHVDVGGREYKGWVAVI